MVSAWTDTEAQARWEAYEAWMRDNVAALDLWLDAQGAARRFGPGCGSAEFEGHDWRQKVRDRLWTHPHWRDEVDRLPKGTDCEH